MDSDSDVPKRKKTRLEEGKVNVDEYVPHNLCNLKIVHHSHAISNLRDYSVQTSDNVIVLIMHDNYS